MMQEMKATLYMLYANYKLSLLSFWAILLGILTILLLSTYLIGASKSEFTLSAPMYFYTPIVAAMVITGVLPFMIKHGVTRFPLFLSLGLFLLVVSVLNAIFVQVIHKGLELFLNMENKVVQLKSGESTFSLNHIGDMLAHKHFLTEMTIDISVSMLLSMLVFLIAIIFYRYGKMIASSMLAIVGILFVLDMTNQGAVYQFFEYVVTHFNFNYFYYIFGVSILVYLFSYLFLYNITLKK